MSDKAVKKFPNAITEKAGLNFNVKALKTNVLEYFESNGFLTPKQVSKFAEDNGFDVALTATLERLCKMLIRNAEQYTHEDKSGIKTLTRETMRYSVYLHEG